MNGSLPAGPAPSPRLIIVRLIALPVACAGRKHSKMAETLGSRSAKEMLRGPAFSRIRIIGVVKGAEEKDRFIPTG